MPAPYDPAGKVQQVSDPTGTYSFAAACPERSRRNNMGRLIGTTTQYAWLPSLNFQNNYTYDAASNRVSLTAPDSSITTYGYDTLNRLNGLANSWAGSFGFGYDALSRRTSLTRPNGVNTSYAYDSVSHLLSVLHQVGTTTLDGASYTYDPAGNRTSKTNYLNGVTSNYGYDPLYELTQVTQGGSTTESYSYDSVGNRLSSSGVPNYNYNASNELTSNSNGTYSYDANGNTLTDAQGRTFTWDFENRLTQAVVPGTNGGTTNFRYDPFGRRIQKSGPLGTTNYLYDGNDLLAEMDASGNLLARYTQGEGIEEPLAQFRSGSASYYETDVLGSVTSTTTPAAAIANSYSYDSFGKTVTSTSPTTNPIRYAARELDSETGIYNDRARYYDPSSGRFISEDPVGFEAGETNFYRYAANDPNDYIDPTGNIIVFSPGSAAGNIVYYGDALGYLGDDPGCSSVIKKLENSPRIFTIDFVYGTQNDGYTSATRTISWDPLGGTCDGGCKLSPAIALCHEMAHAAGDGPIARHLRDTPNAQYTNEEERRVINNYENPFAIRHGECVRFNHNGTPSHVATPTSH